MFQRNSSVFHILLREFSVVSHYTSLSLQSYGRIYRRGARRRHCSIRDPIIHFSASSTQAQAGSQIPANLIAISLSFLPKWGFPFDLPLGLPLGSLISKIFMNKLEHDLFNFPLGPSTHSQRVSGYRLILFWAHLSQKYSSFSKLSGLVLGGLFCSQQADSIGPCLYWSSNSPSSCRHVLKYLL